MGLRFLRAAILSVFLGLTGCTVFGPVGPDFKSPEVVPPDQWLRAAESSFHSETSPMRTWWDVFDDELLKTLIDLVEAGNLDLKTAAERIRESRARWNQRKGAFFPDLDGKGSAMLTRTSESANPQFPPGVDREGERYLVGADLAWELDLWGRVRRSVESAEASHQASVEDYRDVLVILYAEAASTYVEMRTLQQRIAYAEANLEAQKETLQLVTDRNKAGLVSDLDIHQAALNYARTESVLPTLRSALVRARNRLAFLAGRKPGELDEQLGPVAKIPAASKAAAVGIPADLLRQRPDIRRAERQLAAQHARIGATRADLYPAFFLSGTFAWDALDGGDLFKSGSEAYGIGPAFRWNLFDGKRIRSAVKVEESRTAQLLLQYEKTVLAGLEEVENTLVDYLERTRRDTILEKAVTSAQKSVEIAKSLYSQGLIDFQNVLDMEQSLTRQQDEWAANQGNRSKILIRMYKALGGGWTAD